MLAARAFSYGTIFIDLDISVSTMPTVDAQGRKQMVKFGIPPLRGESALLPYRYAASAANVLSKLILKKGGFRDDFVGHFSTD